MSVLHVIRAAAGPSAEAVIRAQCDQGVDVRVLVLDGAPMPDLAAPLHRVGANGIGWDEALRMMFDADTLVAW